MPDARATASTSTPSSAPWRSSPNSRRTRKSCSSAVAPGRGARAAAVSRAAADPAPLTCERRDRTRRRRRAISSDGSLGRRHVAGRRQLRPPIPSRPCRGSPVRKRDDDCELIRRRAFQQVGQPRDLVEPAGGPGDGARGGDDFEEAHVLMLKQSGATVPIVGYHGDP